MSNLRDDGENARVTDKTRMSSAALIEELHEFLFVDHDAPPDISHAIDELFYRHIVKPASERKKDGNRRIAVEPNGL